MINGSQKAIQEIQVQLKSVTTALEIEPKQPLLHTTIFPDESTRFQDSTQHPWLVKLN